MLASEAVVDGVSIIIPSRGDDARLNATLDRYLPHLEASDSQFEVIVVIDGDAETWQDGIREYTSRGVRILRFSQRLGKGGAVLAGFREAKYEYVGFMDADGPIPPESIRDMVDLLREVDGVVASRWISGSRILHRQSARRVLLGRGWNLLVRMILFLPQRDTQCGAKFFKRAAIVPVMRAIAVTNWAFDVDLLYHMKKDGWVVRETPVTWTEGGGSKLSIRRAVPTMLLSLIAIRLMNLPFSARIPRKWVEWAQVTLAKL